MFQDESIHYNKNKNLLKPNTKIKYTPEQIIEIEKCFRDPIYFFEKFCIIIDPDKGKSIIKLRKYQKEKMLKNGLLSDSRFILCLAPRQVGKSVILALFACYYAIFNKDKVIGILANKEKIAKLQLSRVKLVFEQLPIWLKPGIKEWSKTSIEFDNDCKIISSSTASDSARGESIQFLILDEFAFVPPNIQREFFSSVYPTIAASKTSKIVIISSFPEVRTKKELEDNLYWKLYSGAKKGTNSYRLIEINPNEIPGRDEEWKRITLENMGGADDPEVLISFQIEFENKITFSDSSKFLQNKTLEKLKKDCFSWISLRKTIQNLEN